VQTTKTEKDKRITSTNLNEVTAPGPVIRSTYNNQVRNKPTQKASKSEQIDCKKLITIFT
jgi:hypothetical protein